ncbi:MAG: short-chain fatty acid transporter [Flavobacteriales bacterium]|nr:short-chain fatty acid transporter [Flavobacteriales bacterium]MCB9191138.1 short-chain fatty acid transporter [Flavobacteriales bacterium]MCB9203484.1 short-chain fatty acid transporter [Flavobacteriales bacterium]
MSFSSTIEKAFKTLLPAPFTIAVILTIITMVLAFTLTSSDAAGTDRIIEVFGFWENGLWNAPLLVFAMQMMLMLVLGHTLALTKPVDALISYATRFCNNTANAAAIVTLLTVLVALFNWGLGLIFGAILARKVGEHAVRNDLDLNYPLIGAAGYSGLMVWHGGISGSAPIKVAEEGHIHSLMSGIVSSDRLQLLPDSVSFSDTVFSSMNLASIILVVIVLPSFMFWMGKRSPIASFLPMSKTELKLDSIDVSGAEKLDHSKLFGLGIGVIIAVYCIYVAVSAFLEKGFGFINPNYINLLLLGSGLLLHRSFFKFLKAIDEAIGGASGILIQFPLYFGIMGIMNSSGLVQLFSDFFVSISNETTFPIFTFFSAGIVNIFVPSGGGQWGVQGPIILQAASELGVSIPKSIMALAYGDQLTNMLQPFWALPLLGITGLKAKEILPYTVALMGIGIVIFIAVLLIF